MKTIKFAMIAVFSVGAFAVAGGASAASNSANVGISTTVIANCTATSTPVAFGNYDALAASANTATGTLVLTCTQGATPSVAIGLGASSTGPGVRRMTDGVNFLPYSVFKPTSNAAGAACTGASVGYDEAAPGFALVAAPSTAARAFNLCGQIAPSISVPPGAYSDTVLATVTF